MQQYRSNFGILFSITCISVRTTTKPKIALLLCWVVIVVIMRNASPVGALLTTALASSSSSSSSSTTTSGRNQQDRWLVVDFDGTCTVRDTTPLLHRLAYLIESQSHNIDDKDKGENSTRLQLDLRERVSTFSKLENEYYQGYIEVLRSIESEEYNDDDNNNNNNKNNLLQLESSLHRLDCVSNNIIEKVNKSKILRGLGTISPLQYIMLSAR